MMKTHMTTSPRTVLKELFLNALIDGLNSAVSMTPGSWIFVRHETPVLGALAESLVESEFQH